VRRSTDTARFSSRGRRRLLLAVPLIAAFALAAITGVASASSHGKAATIPLSKIPASVRASYDGYQFTAPLGVNPYANWKAPAGPVKMCLNESYEGNTWRQLVLAEFKKLQGQYQKAGLAKGGLQVTNSNNNAAVQITQYQTLVNAGCNVIFSAPASTTAMCPAIAKALAKGVLTITNDTGVVCPAVMNVGFNAYLAQKVGTEAVLKAMGGKGNLLEVTGIPGTPTEGTLEAAVKDALAKYPNVKVVGTVAGNWTGSVAQTAVSQFISTHPDSIDGAVDFGGMAPSIGAALQQAGRPVPLTNSPTGDCPAFAYAHQNPGKVTLITSLDPTAAAYEAFYVAAKMLKGAKPITNNIMYKSPQVDSSNIAQWYKPSMTLTSTCYAVSPTKVAVPNSYFAPLFKGGTPVNLAP
jgi:ribose transport system substrate-binding protein